MKKFNLTLFSLLSCLICFSAMAKDIGTQLDLKDKLFMESKANHRPMSYDDARKIIFGQLYLERTETNQFFLRDFYCHFVIKSPHIGANQIPGNKILNVEHIWPQSKFNRTLSPTYQKSDLHHLLPVDSMANSIRGNHPFGEVSDHRATTYGKCQASWFDYQLNIFEPADELKGNIARAMFYFSIRYKSPIDDEEEAVLRHWNQLDPITDADRALHERIVKYQGNRNPFIDNPELIDSIQNL